MGIAVGITMSTKVKVAAFLLALAASFGVAYGIGASVRPLNGGGEGSHPPAPHLPAPDRTAHEVMR